mgnify:CR=1 FL=1
MQIELNTYETKTLGLYGNGTETIFVNKNGIAFVVQSPDLAATGGEPTRVSNNLPADMVALGDMDAAEIEIPDWVYTEINDTQKAEIDALADASAKAFVDEFGEAYTDESGDWDSTAFQEDVAKLSFYEDVKAHQEVYDYVWEAWSVRFVAQTEELAN